MADEDEDDNDEASEASVDDEGDSAPEWPSRSLPILWPSAASSG